jgi:regulator of cell morphogenesis and NO signaling
METLNLLDLREIEPKNKNSYTLEVFDQLHPNEILTILNDFDPIPLYYQFKVERPESFRWEYIEDGPSIWKINITKIKTRNETSIGEIVRDNPTAASVFRKYKIDYCCHGKMVFDDACHNAGVNPAVVKGEINLAAKSPSLSLRVNNWPLDMLIDYIINNHHNYLKSSEVELKELVDKVARVHGKNHPELIAVKQYLNEFFYELNTHMMKEEEVFFPTIKDLVNNTIEITPSHNYGPITKPLEMLEMDHEDISSFIDLFRRITRNYDIPSDACTSYRLLYLLLKDLEEDLRQHLHLENNILFPKAKALEEEILN